MEQAVQEIGSLSDTEQAKTEFIQQTREIADITIHICSRLAEQSIHVVVPDILGTVADQVSALEVRIRRKYRHACLNIEFELAETRSDEQLMAALSPRRWTLQFQTGDSSP